MFWRSPSHLRRSMHWTPRPLNAAGALPAVQRDAAPRAGRPDGRLAARRPAWHRRAHAAMVTFYLISKLNQTCLLFLTVDDPMCEADRGPELLKPGLPGHWSAAPVVRQRWSGTSALQNTLHCKFI